MEVISVIARAPTAEEIEQAALVAKTAFNSPQIDPWHRAYNWLAEYNGLECIVVVEANDQIVSSLLCTPGQAVFGDDLVPISAIGGVATLPGYRRCGYGELMMREAVRALGRNAIHASVLWPSFYDYYRRFGWEIGCELRKYTLTSDFARELAGPKGVRPARKSDIPAISELVNRFARRHTCVSVRDDTWWRGVEATHGLVFDGIDNVRESRGPWVHESGGQVDAFAFCSIEAGREPEQLMVRELVADTPHARLAVLSRFAGEESPKVISFTAPSDDDFVQGLDNPRAIMVEVEAGFQFRVIDPLPALELRSADPDLSGTLGFDIEDPVLGQSSFDIEIDGGRIVRSDKRSEKRLAMTIQTFSQLYCGYTSAKVASKHGKIATDSRKPLDLATRLLYRATPFRSFLELG